MIVLDVETTGIDFDKHSLLSIGAVDFLHPERQFYEECQMFDGAHIMDGDDDYSNALEYNGFTLEQATDSKKQSDGELVQKFLAWLKQSENHILAGHNHYLDLYFIIATAERHHLDYSVLSKRLIDLHSICYAHICQRGLIPPTKKGHSDINSDYVHQYCGIPPEPRPHNGLNGAKWEAESLSRLLYSKWLLPEFEQYPVLWKS